MPLPRYEDRGPVDCTSFPDLTRLTGRSAVVTGGASGIGRAYAEALVKAGVYVTIGDIDVKAGTALAEANKGNAQFFKCDVTNWEDQVAMFKAAIENSPHNSCDIVLANAGITEYDPVFKFDDPSGDPEKPDLKILDVNLKGAIYTTKLALHYFRKHGLDESRDRCLVLQGSTLAYHDMPGAPQYQVSKFGLRGLMANLRRTVTQQDMRVNLIAPWLIQTPILSDVVVSQIKLKGIEFALAEDAAAAVLRIAADKDINGRALSIVPRSDAAPRGFRDVAHDDLIGGDFLKEFQEQCNDFAYSLMGMN